jgi:hypothetical protein
MHQVPHDADTITRCSVCQFDARWAQAPSVDNTAGRYRMMQVQRLLVEAFRQGAYPLTRTQCVATPEFLSVLRHLGRLVIAPTPAQTLRRGCCGEMGEPYFAPSFPSSRGRALEVLSVTDRFRVMLLVAWWLGDWPDQFVAICAMAELTVTDLVSRFLSPPSWYEHAVWQVAAGRFAGMKFASYGTVRSLDTGKMQQIL